MITALLSLLGGGLGGLMRYIPELIKIFTTKQDHDHEYRMTQLQLEIDRARAGQAIDLAYAQGEVALQTGQMSAYIEAIKSQGQLTGVKWIDGLSASVRPILTYWWMLVYTAYKGLLIYAYCADWAGVRGFVGVLWSEWDAGILSMMIGFWFVDRAIKWSRR